MKTLVTPLLLTLAITCASLSATLATSHPIGIIRPKTAVTYRVHVYSTVGGKLTVALDKEAGGRVRVALKDANGHLLFSEFVTRNDTKFRMRLDLNELPDGSYTVECSNGVDTTRQTVTLSTNTPEIPKRILMTDPLVSAI